MMMMMMNPDLVASESGNQRRSTTAGEGLGTKFLMTDTATTYSIRSERTELFYI